MKVSAGFSRTFLFQVGTSLGNNNADHTDCFERQLYHRNLNHYEEWGVKASLFYDIGPGKCPCLRRCRLLYGALIQIAMEKLKRPRAPVVAPKFRQRYLPVIPIRVHHQQITLPKEGCAVSCLCLLLTLVTCQRGIVSSLVVERVGFSYLSMRLSL